MTDFIELVREASGGRAIELIAVLLGLANVGLLMRRSIWNYPFGIAMVAIYAFIYYGEKLYSDAILQIFFFIVQIYGWMQWACARDGDGLVIVEALHPRAALIYGAAALALWIGFGASMKFYTDASYPFWDSSILALSVVAQIMLARRHIENWLLWIAVDLLAIGLYAAKDLYPTAALYAVFLAMSVGGYFSWRRGGVK